MRVGLQDELFGDGLFASAAEVYDDDGLERLAPAHGLA